MEMKLDKKAFLDTELGSNLKECITSWDTALDDYKKYPYGTEGYKRGHKVAGLCQAQWEIYKMAIRQFYGIEYCFTRTDEYFGICTEDEKDWLFKIGK